MKRTRRAATLTLSLIVASMLAAVIPAFAATGTTVAYKKVVKTCSTYSMDGQEQKQCQADFTAAVSGVKSGYQIIVTVRDPEHATTSIVGKFASTGSTASQRFGDVVTSYGSPGDQIRMRFRIVVKNSAGQKVHTSKPRTI